MRFAARVRTLVWAIALSAAVALLIGLLTPVARAGIWMQVSCVNPSGTPSPSQGWTGSLQATGFGASTTTSCAPGAPMSAVLADAVPEPVYAGASLTYTPPVGSILTGGRLGLVLQANGGGTNANGAATVSTPTQAAGDARLQCVEGQTPCGSQGADYSGTFTLPSGLGGVLVVGAQCVGSPGFSCDSGGRSGAWAQAQVSVADLLLSNNSRPRATGRTGTALDRPIHATALVALKAVESSGPGIYQVAAMIDGRLIQRITPSLNAGTCVPVGTDATTGALMFDVQQPCPTSTPALLTIPTTGLPDGDHLLQITITDAAGNVATVVRRTIVTVNPLLTPRPRAGVRTRFALSWRWGVSATTLRSVTAVRALPHDATVTLACTGAGCPRLYAEPQSAARLAGLLRSLRNRRFATGDRLLITITAPHLATERLGLTMRSGRAPRAAFVKAPPTLPTLPPFPPLP